MKLLSRSVLMQAHALLAVFILPAVIMFFLTGALYTWGIKGGYETTVHPIQLKSPLQQQLGELVMLAETELKKRNLAVPTGQAKIKTMGNSYQLVWTGSTMDVIVEPTMQPLIAQLQLKNASGYRQFVQLHKAKGGELFKVYAKVLAAGLLILLISGFIMAWQMASLQKLTAISTAVGVVVFVGMILFS